MLPVLGSGAPEWREVGALGFAWEQQKAGQGRAYGAPPVTQGGQALTSTLGGWAPAVACSPPGGIGWRHGNGCYQGAGKGTNAALNKWSWNKIPDSMCLCLNKQILSGMD